MLVGCIVKGLSVAAIKIIGIYQYFVGPFLPPSCRFSVSCSEYAVQAIKKQGLFIGIYLICFRLIKCQAFYCNLLEREQR